MLRDHPFDMLSGQIYEPYYQHSGCETSMYRTKFLNLSFLRCPFLLIVLYSLPGLQTEDSVNILGDTLVKEKYPFLSYTISPKK